MNEKDNCNSTSPLLGACDRPKEAQSRTTILSKVETHKVSPERDLLEIAVMDGPGPGGANHVYLVYWPRTERMIESMQVKFQHGPIREAGVNGITNEALLAIVEHRLQSFQKGPFACEENQVALENVTRALVALKRRTLERMARGVEGSNQQ